MPLKESHADANQHLLHTFFYILKQLLLFLLQYANDPETQSMSERQSSSSLLHDCHIMVVKVIFTFHTTSDKHPNLRSLRKGRASRFQVNFPALNSAAASLFSSKRGVELRFLFNLMAFSRNLS